MYYRPIYGAGLVHTEGVSFSQNHNQNKYFCFLKFEQTDGFGLVSISLLFRFACLILLTPTYHVSHNHNHINTVFIFTPPPYERGNVIFVHIVKRDQTREDFCMAPHGPRHSIIGAIFPSTPTSH